MLWIVVQVEWSKKLPGTYIEVNIPYNFNSLPDIVRSWLLKVCNLNRKHPSLKTNYSGFVWIYPRNEVFVE